MLYKNNENLKVVDMCKIFDEEFAHPETRDDNKLFKYMYMIIFAITIKEKRWWFHNYEDFDKYASFAARTLYLRFMKQQSEGKKIKSIRNYFRSSMGFLKIMFQNEDFSEVIDPEFDDFSTAEFVGKFQDSLSDDYYRADKLEELEGILSNAPSTAKEIVQSTPYKDDKAMCHRLYLSMLLSFLNSITLPKKDAIKVERATEKDSKEGDSMYVQLLAKESEKEPVLWNLDEGMSDYVRMLLNKMRESLANEVRDVKAYYTIPEDVVSDIMATAYNDGRVTNSEDFD